MPKLLLLQALSLVFIFCPDAYARRKLTLADTMTPAFYLKHEAPVLNIAVVYYGNERNESDIQRIKALLEKRFFLATQSMIRLNTTFTAQIPYRNRIEDHPEYHHATITDPARLQRLWYYDFVGENILTEVYQETKKNTPPHEFRKLDALAVMTGAQFDGMGFAEGRVAVTESPREIAWNLPDGGRTDETSDGQVVDELIHELGHTLFLDHAASQCFGPDLSYEATLKCCAASPNRDDVMSYCRARGKVDNENQFYGFKECNLRTIKEKIIPALLQGAAWRITNREKCL